MSFFDTAREKIREHFEKGKVDREKMEELHKEANNQRQMIFKEQFKKDSLEVAKAKAYKDAAEKSGLQKLRAETRLRRLNETSSAPEPGTWREKMRDYTAKNIAQRQENLKRTEEMRAKAEEMRNERVQKPIPQRPQNMNKGIKPPIRRTGTLADSKPTWRM